ncbi:uncharacterized protein LOC143148584 [Ptiloglossa arizonensis]|uniref:uncharacterized protein LOC143148584 n=1 Tax=Ptiloglossa arizonensis TaxID=3350558 RepID=UPI003F9F73FC
MAGNSAEGLSRCCVLIRRQACPCREYTCVYTRRDKNQCEIKFSINKQTFQTLVLSTVACLSAIAAPRCCERSRPLDSPYSIIGKSNETLRSRKNPASFQPKIQSCE